MAQTIPGWSSGLVAVALRSRSWRGGSSSERRRSCSSRSPSAVMVNPRQLAEARSRTAHTRVRQLVSPGRRPMTLTRRRVSPKVRPMKLVLGGAPQVGGQAFAVGEQDLDRRRVQCPILGGEGIDAGVDDLDQLRAGGVPEEAGTVHRTRAPGRAGTAPPGRAFGGRPRAQRGDPGLANGQGIAVSARGRIPADVVERYEAAAGGR